MYWILPPGGIILSEPPGASDMYLSPSSPEDVTCATVSSGNCTAGSMLMRIVAR